MTCSVGEEADARMCSRGGQGGPLHVSRTRWKRRQTTFNSLSTVSRSPDLSPACERILSRACENRMHALSAEKPAAPQQCWAAATAASTAAPRHTHAVRSQEAQRDRAKEGGGGDSQRTRCLKSGHARPRGTYVFMCIRYLHADLALVLGMVGGEGPGRLLHDRALGVAAHRRDMCVCVR